MSFGGDFNKGFHKVIDHPGIKDIPVIGDMVNFGTSIVGGFVDLFTGKQRRKDDEEAARKQAEKQAEEAESARREAILQEELSKKHTERYGTDRNDRGAYLAFEDPRQALLEGRITYDQLGEYRNQQGEIRAGYMREHGNRINEMAGKEVVSDELINHLNQNPLGSWEDVQQRNERTRADNAQAPSLWEQKHPGQSRPSQEITWQQWNQSGLQSNKNALDMMGVLHRHAEGIQEKNKPLDDFLLPSSMKKQPESQQQYDGYPSWDNQQQWESQPQYDYDYPSYGYGSGSMYDMPGGGYDAALSYHSQSGGGYDGYPSWSSNDSLGFRQPQYSRRSVGFGGWGAW
jgi:hypothetical protein